MLKRWMILIALGALLLLTACSSSTLPAHSSSNSGASGNTAVPGSIREYALPQEESGLMRPVVDHAGRVWFGEMAKNALGVFDPHSHTFQHFTPPDGNYGIMGIAVASDDSIWFAEQNANYIGHFLPTTQQFQTYALPTLTTSDPNNSQHAITLPSAPNDLALDAHGNVWFTEQNADMLGMLNVQSGQFTHYPLSPHKSIQTITPYGIAIDRQGIVWFTENSTDTLGRLDPSTGSIRLFPVQNATGPLMELASDAQGNIWSTTFTTEALVRFNSRTATFSNYPIAHASGTEGMYGLSIAPDGTIWAAVTAANELVALHIKSTQNTYQYAYYPIPTDASLPIGVAVDARKDLWFTESAGNKLGELDF